MNGGYRKERTCRRYRDRRSIYRRVSQASASLRFAEVQVPLSDRRTPCVGGVEITTNAEICQRSSERRKVPANHRSEHAIILLLARAEGCREGSTARQSVLRRDS